MYGMRRTTVYLPDDLKAALERTAAVHGKSEAEVVRGAIAAATADHAHPRHASRDQPCSVMSGHTPVAISWSIARRWSMSTPLRRMISIKMSSSPWVCDRSGLRFRVQLTNSARRSE